MTRLFSHRVSEEKVRYFKKGNAYTGQLGNCFAIIIRNEEGYTGIYHMYNISWDKELRENVLHKVEMMKKEIPGQKKAVIIGCADDDNYKKKLKQIEERLKDVEIIGRSVGGNGILIEVEIDIRKGEIEVRKFAVHGSEKLKKEFVF